MRPCRARKGRPDLGPRPGPPAQHGSRTHVVLVPEPRLGEKESPVANICGVSAIAGARSCRFRETCLSDLATASRSVALVKPDNDVVRARFGALRHAGAAVCGS